MKIISLRAIYTVLITHGICDILKSISLVLHRYLLMKIGSRNTESLSLATELQRVASQPACSPGTSSGLSVTMTLAQASGFASSTGQASHLSVILHVLADPVDLGITPDGLQSTMYDYKTLLVRNAHQMLCFKYISDIQGRFCIH
jgi:hypothetical protein